MLFARGGRELQVGGAADSTACPPHRYPILRADVSGLVLSLGSCCFIQHQHCLRQGMHDTCSQF